MLGAVGTTIYLTYDERRAGDEAAEIADELEQAIGTADESAYAASDGESASGKDSTDSDLSASSPELYTASGGGQSALRSAKFSSLDQKDENAIVLSELLPEMEMPTLDIKGSAYIGILEIPDLGLYLPVLGEWSYSGLRRTPARYSGSAYTDDLIILGHNYQRHFGSLKTLTAKAQVNFIDVSGTVFHYKVTKVEILDPYAVKDMIINDADLTLFTCTYGGQSRVTVRCEKIN